MRSPFDAEPVLRLSFQVAVLVAFVSAGFLSVGLQRYTEDVLAGRATEAWWPRWVYAFSAARVVGLTVALACVGGSLWFSIGRGGSVHSRRPPAIALALVLAGTCLGIFTGLWLAASGSPQSFGDIWSRAWITGAAGFAEPLIALGLGLMTFPVFGASK